MSRHEHDDLQRRTALLAWYDRHRRALPWRAPAGSRAEPYRVWLSEVMLQQTTVAAVAPFYRRFLERFPTLDMLAAAPLDEVLRLWAGLGYYSRARNLHACARAVMGECGGIIPAELEALLALPGVGRYTAAAVAAIAFDRPVVPVDGNVERVLTRVFAVEQSLPAAKPALAGLAARFASPDRPGDFAQALMDLGATICTPRRPACALCPWRQGCRAAAQGRQEEFPHKAPKADRPQRHGIAFVVRRADGAVLLRRRAPEGLLGAMTEVPTTAWIGTEEGVPSGRPPVDAAFVASGTVRHVFTHFALTLSIMRAAVSVEMAAPADGFWAGPEQVRQEALPSLFRKVLAVGLGEDPLRPKKPKRRSGA